MTTRFDQWVEEVRGLMRGDEAKLQRGYTLANALNAVAEMHALSVLEVAILAERYAQPGRHKVTFIYTDELLGEDREHLVDDELSEGGFATEAEAKAFGDGLSWGDEPKFTVLSIEPEIDWPVDHAGGE